MYNKMFLEWKWEVRMREVRESVGVNFPACWADLTKQIVMRK